MFARGKPVVVHRRTWLSTLSRRAEVLECRVEAIGQHDAKDFDFEQDGGRRHIKLRDQLGNLIHERLSPVRTMI